MQGRAVGCAHGLLLSSLRPVRSVICWSESCAERHAAEAAASYAHQGAAGGRLGVHLLVCLLVAEQLFEIENTKPWRDDQLPSYWQESA